MECSNTAQKAEETRLEQRLIEHLRGLGDDGVLLAFSGGVDSSYLLAVCAEAFGVAGGGADAPTAARAVLGVSPSLSAAQHRQAREVAQFLGVTLEEVPTTEVARPEYLANTGDRCFFCKDTLFATLRRLAPGAVILDGTQADDATGHRPGRDAARQHGVRSPLLEMGIGKAAIRRLSARRGLQTADLPAAPCLASRFPAGTPVTLAGLARVEAAEELVRSLGFRELRVRHHAGDVARIEVPLSEASRVVGTEAGRSLSDGLKRLGFRFVTLDLEGFRSGSSSTLG